MNSFVTFIIPTIGRSTIQRTINSLLSQTDQDYKAVVVADCISERDFKNMIVDNDSFFFINLEEKLGHDNVGAEVRNFGLTLLKHSVNKPEWVANLDDDDTLDIDYVKYLKEESQDNTLIQFRAVWENGIDIRPTLEETRLLAQTVSNAFAFRLAFAEENNLRYVDTSSEDWSTIESFISAGARAKLSDRIAYKVRH